MLPIFWQDSLIHSKQQEEAMATTTAQIRSALAAQYPATALMNLVEHGLSYSRASWWYRHVYGAEANLQDAAERESLDRQEHYEAIYGSTMYERELRSPR